MRFTAYIRWQHDGGLVDVVYANTARDCWYIAYNHARYSGATTFQIIDNKTGWKYKRYYVDFE